MDPPSHDPSIEFEPHMRPASGPPRMPPEILGSAEGNPYESTPAADRAADPADSIWCEPTLAPVGTGQDPHQVDHTVWDEPALSHDLAGSLPPAGLNYARWLLERRQATTPLFSWLVTGLIVVASGPWSVMGTILLAGETSYGALTAILGSLVEEVMKISLALTIVETRPYWFRSSTQIVLCCAGAGLGFAALENVLYLNEYLNNPTAELIAWRWTVCVALHTACSLIAGLGLLRVWRNTMTQLARPQIHRALGWIVVAFVIHAAYNAAVLFT